MSAVVTTSCPDLELIASGKVRDLYRIDASTLLFVATDRISAFDVIMDNVSLGQCLAMTHLLIPALAASERRIAFSLSAMFIFLFFFLYLHRASPTRESC